jgi:uncharacterized membrane protein YdbT with pleckstrin-like domain
MSYVQRTLGNKETVLFSTGYHWLYWLGVSLLAGRFIRGISLEVAVTTDRFVKKTGFVSITTEEVSLDKIEEVNVDESILGRIFGYGTVSVHGTGAGDISVDLVTDPVGLRRQIQTAREHIRHRGE